MGTPHLADSEPQSHFCLKPLGNQAQQSPLCEARVMILENSEAVFAFVL